jgi:hypothetical protein
MIRNKKASHVGMILSFVIFITFTVFIYSVVSPSIDNPESKRTLLNEIGLKLITNMSSDFTSLSIQINNNQEENCIQLQNLILLISRDIDYFNKLVAKNEEGNVQYAYGNFSNLKIDRQNSDNVFFKVYFSPEFSSIGETTKSCVLISEPGYKIGSVFSGKYIFEKNMYWLVDYYNSNYEKLKSELRISPGDEFGFEFILSNGTRIIAVEELPTQNIYAEDIPVQYIDDEANILSGFINVKVW